MAGEQELVSVLFVVGQTFDVKPTMIELQADPVWSIALDLADAIFDDDVADKHTGVMKIRVVMRRIRPVRRLDMDIERHGYMRVQISLDGCRLN